MISVSRAAPNVFPMTSAPTPDSRPAGSTNAFARELAARGVTLARTPPRVLQLNVGKLCNLTCTHCHVNAGPKRKEIITRETIERVLAWQAEARLPTIDLTGGAPEMIPDFRYLVRRLRADFPHAEIIDRCNLTILLAAGYADLPEFLAAERVTLIASMPCYSAENVNTQRGDGVFEQSVAALQRLNALGYGRAPELPLHLVYNPNGAFLPGAQPELEADYKRELRAHFGIEFNRLFTLTNLPIARFASWLRHNGKYEEYLTLLVSAFNPATLDGLMCRDTVSVSWRGEVFDCDFNQMLGLPLGAADDEPHENKRAPVYLWDIDPRELAGRPIRTGEHCFGCTAGAGSSCGGALVT